MKIISFNIVACEKKTPQVLIRLYSTVLQGINIPGIRSQQEQLFCREQRETIYALSASVNINQKHEQWTNTTRLLLCVKNKQTKHSHTHTHKKTFPALILYIFIY